MRTSIKDLNFLCGGSFIKEKWIIFWKISKSWNISLKKIWIKPISREPGWYQKPYKHRKIRRDMGRKLTADKTHTKSKLKGTYKTAAVRSHKKRVKKVFRRGFSKSAKEEPFGIRQVIEKKSGKSFFKKIISILP